MFEGEKINQEKIRVVYDGGPDLAIFEPNKYNGNIVREEFEIGIKQCSFLYLPLLIKWSHFYHPLVIFSIL